MSLFFISPPNTPHPTDAWRVLVEVDPCDWEEAPKAERLRFLEELHGRYVDTNGNSAYDLVQVVAGGVTVRFLELHSPPRRSGPVGTDNQKPRYVRGPDARRKA